MVIDRPRGRAGAALARTLEHAGPTRRQWRRWSAWEPVLAERSYDELRAKLHDRNGAYEHNDEVLAALCRIARIDADAMAIIAALLLPGLGRRADRQWVLDPEEAWSELVTALCRHIKRYDTARRPRYVAANLLQDAVRDLRRSTPQTPVESPAICTPEGTDGTAAGPSTEENVTASLVLESAMRAGIISRSEAALIHQTVVAGVRLRDAARALGITQEAAKKRRQRALPRLGDWWHGDHRAPQRNRGGRTKGAP